MKNRILFLPSFLFITLLTMLCSCGSDNDNSEDIVTEVPMPIQEFYFQGVLGEEEFNLKVEIYDTTINVPINEHNIDYGGFGIERTTRRINSEEIEYCLGDYAFGVVPAIGSDANVALAKMYLRDIDLKQCSIANEKLGIETSLDANNFVYTNFLGDETINRTSFYYYLAISE